jgi:glycosyltransferase involved in cell wall biosynthesis
MERWVYHRVHHVIAGNQDAVRVIRGKGYRGPATVIPQFGVDPTLFSPVDGASDPSHFTIGYAGRLEAKKGVDLLLDAVTDLSTPWQLCLIGDGPRRASLERRVTALGIGNRVEFRGRVPSVEMPANLRSLDVLVVPSLTTPSWREQFGRVLQEAMACEVAVVGSDSGEIPNVIGDAGIVVPEGNADALTKALKRLAGSPDLRDTLARRGRARVLERFTQQSIADRTVETYRRVMARDR